jgi:polyhydroxyalkanoate synthesis regulator phasin
LLEEARPALQRLIDDQQAQRLARQHSGKRLIAELLLDCAACRRSVEPAEEAKAIEALRRNVRQREQRCVEALLKLCLPPRRCQCR